MKNLGLMSMILGVLATINSMIFGVINIKYDAIVLSFWVLLSLFELFFLWRLLFSKDEKLQVAQKAVLLVLMVLALVWITVTTVNPSRTPIFRWALNTLSFSVLFFAGLLIYHRERN